MQLRLQLLVLGAQEVQFLLSFAQPRSQRRGMPFRGLMCMGEFKGRCVSLLEPAGQCLHLCVLLTVVVDEGSDGICQVSYLLQTSGPILRDRCQEFAELLDLAGASGGFRLGGY